MNGRVFIVFYKRSVENNLNRRRALELVNIHTWESVFELMDDVTEYLDQTRILEEVEDGRVVCSCRDLKKITVATTILVFLFEIDVWIYRLRRRQYQSV